MRRILVFGGTRYFGKRLVELLLANGDQVTIATRGNVKDDFGDRVFRVIVDRVSEESMKKVFSDLLSWDIIYDNICYSSNEAKIAVELFDGKVQKYIFTSTMSVYGLSKAPLIESDFDSSNYSIEMLNRQDTNYGEAKRMAESYYIQKAAFPIVAPRFPIILGMDDYTRRLHFHIERVMNDQEIGFYSLDTKISFITSEEAAGFLFWAGKSEIVGSINACSNGEITLKELVQVIEKVTGEQAVIVDELNQEQFSPFSLPDDWFMSNMKARTAGFTFKDLEEWFPKLVKDIYDHIKNNM